MDNDDVVKMELVFHFPDSSEKKISYSIQGKREMILVHWDDIKKANQVSWHFYNRDGGEIALP